MKISFVFFALWKMNLIVNIVTFFVILQQICGERPELLNATVHRIIPNCTIGSEVKERTKRSAFAAIPPAENSELNNEPRVRIAKETVNDCKGELNVLGGRESCTFRIRNDVIQTTLYFQKKHYYPFKIENVGIVPLITKVRKRLKTIGAGERVIFDDPNLDNLEISNPKDDRAIFYCVELNGEFPSYPPYDKTTIPPPYRRFDKRVALLPIAMSRTLVGENNIDGSSKFNFYESSELAEILQLFPNKATGSEWMQMMDYISDSIKNGEVMRDLRNKIETHLDPLLAELKVLFANKNMDCFEQDFGYIVYNIITDLPMAFVFAVKYPHVDEINYHLLPLYSRVVSIVMSLYNSAVTFWRAYGFHNRFIIPEIITRRESLVSAASEHVARLSKYAIKHVYNSEEVNIRNMYNNIMNVRTHIAVNGQQYLAAWYYSCHRASRKLDYSNLAFSGAFGAITPKLIQESYIGTDKSALRPSISAIDNGIVIERKKIAQYTIEVDYDHNTINSISVVHGSPDETSEVYGAGTRGVYTYTVPLHENTIKQIEIHGIKTINYMQVTLSNGTVKQYGISRKNPGFVFKLQNYHIAGIYVEPCRDLDFRVCNMAVSYSLDHLDIGG